MGKVYSVTGILTMQCCVQCFITYEVVSTIMIECWLIGLLTNRVRSILT